MATPTSPFALRPTVVAAAIALHALAATAQMAPAPAASSTDTGITLNTVTVSADASAEGLPKPFAGGQVARGARIGILGNQDTMDTPFASTSYTGELIQDQQARSIGDVLLNDASVRLTRGYGNFQQAYFIRGFTVYSDDVTYNGLYGLVPRQYMAAEFIERVEVFRGANTFLGGVGGGGGSAAGGGIGGVINTVPKRAPNDPLSRVTAGVQSGGEGYLGVDVARRFGPDQSTGIRLNVARRDGDGAVHRENASTDVASVGLDWRSRTVRLSADVGYQNNRQRATRPSVTPGATPIPAAPDASGNFSQPWTYSKERDFFGTVRGEWDFSDQVTGWAAVGTRRSKEANSLTAPTLADALGNTTEYRADNTRKDTIETGEIGVRARFRTAGIGHTAVLSASTFNSKSRNAFAWYNYGAQTANNIYNPVVVAPHTALSFAGGTLANPLVTESIRTTGIVAADTLSMLDDSLLLTLGLRHQTIVNASYDYTSGVQNGYYDQSRTTPMAGIVFKASKQLSFYGNYIEGLVKGDVAAGGGVTNAGQIFAPYVSRQKEVGVKYDGGSIGASVALFSTSKPLAYVEGGLYGVFGEQRNRGVEFSLFGEPTRGLRLISGLTLLSAKQVQTQGSANNGNDAIGVPRHQLNVGADWDVPGLPNLSLNARVINTGKQYANAANTLSIPSWTRTDIGARYLVDLGNSRLLTLRARVENVFDKNYWASTGGYPGQGYLAVGAPRTFVLTASVDF